MNKSHWSSASSSAVFGASGEPLETWSGDGLEMCVVCTKGVRCCRERDGGANALQEVGLFCKSVAVKEAITRSRWLGEHAMLGLGWWGVGCGCGQDVVCVTRDERLFAVRVFAIIEH